MAHLWLSTQRESGDREWSLLSLGADTYDMTTKPPTRMKESPVAVPRDTCDSAGSDVWGSYTERRAGEVVLQRCRSTGANEWVLLLSRPTNVYVNGHAVSAHLRVLNDRDEIRVGDETFFFSTEELPRKVVFPGLNEPVFCPRCLQEVTIAGQGGEPTMAVRCPSCGVWYHETLELGCWTYSDTCMTCPQPTNLSGGFQWTPEAL